MTIGSIRGQLSLVEDQEIIVEVGGVGYRIFIPPMTQKQFGETGCETLVYTCLLYTSPSPRDRQKSRMPSSA